jgi:hypothetical protein
MLQGRAFAERLPVSKLMLGWYNVAEGKPAMVKIPFIRRPNKDGTPDKSGDVAQPAPKPKPK